MMLVALLQAEQTGKAKQTKPTKVETFVFTLGRRCRRCGILGAELGRYSCSQQSSNDKCKWFRDHNVTSFAVTS